MLTIHTKRLILRPFKKEDTRDVYLYSVNDNVARNAGWKPHANIQETESIMREIFIDKDNMFAIEYDKKVIGSIGLGKDISRDGIKCLMLGYALSEEYWGKGFMTESCKAVIAYAFTILNLDMISITCYTDNLRSERVIEKCGFEFEGVLHNATLLYDGSIKDKKYFYLTKEKYLQILQVDLDAQI
ncbi:MAG: GNAT family protein [Clostridia bacterium]